MATVPGRFAEMGDLHAGIDDAVFAFDELLEWADRDERAGAEPPARPRRLDPTRSPEHPSHFRLVEG